jgi:polysaccharide chain length determinant protein (PEP-CTERM system associated)
MVRNGEISVDDARRVFRRYWWLVPLCVIACTAIALVLTMVLPKKYTSKTTVLVDEPTVPQDYVKPVVGDTLGLLASMQEQILSSSRLELIVDKFGLYPEDRGTSNKAALAERLKDAIKVSPLVGMPGTTNSLPGFEVSVKFSSPQLAHDICAEVTSMFLSQNAKLRETVGTETASFLTQQLAEAKQSLDQQDAALADFKKKHLGYLPEEEQANLQLLAGLNTQLDATTQSINRIQQDKAVNQTMLDQVETNWKQLQSGVPSADSLESQLAMLQEQLTGMLIKYTPDHPDVIKVKAQIADLKKRIAEEPDNPEVSAKRLNHEPLQLQQLRLKIKQEDATIADLTKRQSQIVEQIRVIEGRIQSSPVIEQEFKELTRNYETASDTYKDLLRKQGASKMGNDLEREQEGERFSIIDPPSMPTSPSFPNTLYFAGGGFGGGLVLSLGLMYMLAMADKSMYSERDVESCLKVPVLTIVPNLHVTSINNVAARQKLDNGAVVFKA